MSTLATFGHARMFFFVRAPSRLPVLSEDLCAVGRRITRDDDKGCLDWRSPCPLPVDEDCRLDLTGMGYGEIVLCAQHGTPVAGELYDALVVVGFDRLN